MNDISIQDSDDRELIDAVMTLPKQYRIVIHLYYYEDYSVSEIGKILDVSKSVVKNRLFRGRKMLKDILQEEWTNVE